MKFNGSYWRPGSAARHGFKMVLFTDNLLYMLSFANVRHTYENKPKMLVFAKFYRNQRDGGKFYIPHNNPIIPKNTLSLGLI